jgi:hypothetical protein
MLPIIQIIVSSSILIVNILQLITQIKNKRSNKIEK